MSFLPRIHEIYKHFKGGLYQVTAIAEHTETGEVLVVYQAMYGDFKTYARPLAMFVSRVDRDKYPEVEQEFRFALQGPDAARQAAESEPEAEVITAESVSVTTLERTEVDDQEAESAIDPMLLEFLDADSYAERLNILAALQHRVTDEMITTMAIASDVEIEDGDLESRYAELRNCLLTLERYECNRLH